MREPFIKRMWNPPLRVFWPCLLVGALLLCAVFWLSLTALLWLAIPIYLFCSWVLICAVLRISAAAERQMKRNEHLRRFLEDREFQTAVNTLTSMLLDLFYIALQAVTAALTHSVWSATVALYHLILGTTRLLLLRGLHREQEDLARELRETRLCGQMLLWMSAVVMMMNFYSAVEGKKPSYPGVTIYAVAFYTFYCLFSAAQSLVWFHRSGNPLCAASKGTSLAAVLVSLLSLQEAMISTFGSGSSWEETLRVFTGFGIFLLIAVISVSMIVNANRWLRRLREH